jgi:glutathione synthase/RimK-type ligase-like ATP-grasp enzyme
MGSFFSFHIWNISTPSLVKHLTVLVLDAFDVILMRKDPPFDMNYIYATYFLEQAEKYNAQNF